jgi:transcriptional regulator with XRE-family HTH domain
MTKEDQLTRDRLQAAFRKLKANNIIKYDKEVAEDLGYEQATVSQYKNGKHPASFEFITKFEKKYNIRLADMDINGKKQPEDKATRLFMLIAKKIGITDAEIKKALK